MKGGKNLDVGFQGKERQKKIGYWVSSKRKLERNWILCLNQKKGGMKFGCWVSSKRRQDLGCWI